MKLLPALFIMALLASPSASRALGPMDIDSELGLFNRHVWRGIIVRPSTVLQPWVSAEVVGFGLKVWGNIDSSHPYNNDWAFDEIDLVATYEINLPRFDFTGGVTYYHFFNLNIDETTDLFIKGRAHVLLSPSLEIYRDLDLFKGTYINGGVSHVVTLGPSLGIGLSANLGYGSEGNLNSHFGVERAGLADIAFGIIVPFHPVPTVTITPRATFTSLLGDVRSKVESEDRETVMFGLTAGASF